MPRGPSKLSNFWNELKRRRVIHVIVVYATAAFVILELTDIIGEPFGLPEWTLKLVFVLLCVGLVIAIIFSWIYDMTPEGLERTKPPKEIEREEIRPVPNTWRIATYVSVVIIIGLVVFNLFGGKRVPRIDESLAKSIAVLPFHNYSGDPGQDYMCEGLTDEIISHLFKVRSFDEVRSLTSVLPFKDSEKSTTEIAQTLKVNYILEGTYKRIGDELRITAQLIEPKSDNHIWLQDYDLPYDQVIGIPTEIALKIADHLKAFITEDEQQLIEKKPTDNLDAYEYYILGKIQLYKREGDEERWKAVEYFQRAVETDASFALAYSGLAEAYYQLINFSIQSPKEAYPKAKAAALKALSLNNGLANSHCTLALIKQSFEYDFEDAEREYKRALDIDPRSFETHYYYAIYLSLMGRHEEAVSHITLATELDPFSPMVELSRIIIQYDAGYKSEAVEAIEKYRDTYPENPYGYWYCALFYTDHGRYEEALQMLKTQIITMGDDNISDEVGLQGFLYGRLGQREKAVKQMDQLNILSSEGYYIDPRARVWVYLGINELDTAIEILKESFDDQLIDPLYLRAYPSEYVRHDPGFIEIQKSIGLID